MKILISGSTRTQCFGYMGLRPIACLSGFMQPILENAGHEVIMAYPDAVDLGVLKPDFIFLGLSPASGLAANLSFYAYDLYRQAKQVQIPVVWFVDDKAINQIPSHMGSWLRGYEKRVDALCGTGRRKGTKEFAMSVKDTTLGLFAKFLEGKFPEPIIVAMWNPDGEKDPRTEKYFCGNRTIYIDPSSAVELVEPLGKVEQKKRQWMIANLGDYGTIWLRKTYGSPEHFTWPLITFGKVDKVQMPRASQPDMLNIHYPESWGIMSPSYPMSVGRLYRTRFAHAALAKSIMLSTHQETIDYFGSTFKFDPLKIEQYSDADLAALGHLQATVFWQKTWSRVEFTQRLNNIINEALR